MSENQKESSKKKSLKDKIKRKKPRETMNVDDMAAYLTGRVEVSSTVEALKVLNSPDNETEPPKSTTKSTNKSTYKSTYFFEDEPDYYKVGIRVEPELYNFIKDRLGPRGYTKFYKVAGDLLRDEILKAEKGETK